jgi:hypothetical protein
MTTGNDHAIMEVLQEVQARSRRTETRLMRLCGHFGVDPANKDRCRTVASDTIEVSAMDVSLGDCLTYCQQKGLIGTIRVMHGDVMIGTLDTGVH